MSWANVEEAMAYFGVKTPEELEEIIVDHDIDALVSNDGRLLGIEGHHEMKEALFERHKKVVGHRPDDEVAHEAAVAMHHATVASMKAQRKEHRKAHLDKRVKDRKVKEARSGRTATADTGA